MKKITFTCLVIICGLSTQLCAQTKPKKPSTAKPELSDDKLIIGTWVSEKDSLWRLTFTADKKCKQYYDSKLSERDTVILSNKTPQCGETVPVTINTNYLQLINMADRSDHICYEIAGLTKKALTIRPVDSGGFTMFYKQENTATKNH